MHYSHHKKIAKIGIEYKMIFTVIKEILVSYCSNRAITPHCVKVLGELQQSSHRLDQTTQAAVTQSPVS